MAVRIDIGGRDTLAAQIDKQNKKWQETGRLLKENVKLGKEGARELGRLIESQRTPQERYNRTLDQANKLLKSGAINQQQYSRAVEAANRRLERQSKKTSELGNSMGALGSRFTSFAGIAATALRGVSAQLETLNRQADATLASLTAQQSFVELQPEGTRSARRQKVLDLARKFGVGQDRLGSAFDVTQALQSVPGGTFPAALEGAKSVFRAGQLGVPLQAAKEAEVVGQSLGQKPGQTLRSFFIAGKLSGRSPQEVIPAAAALGEFESLPFAAALASQLSGTVPVDQLSVLTRRAGTALSAVGPVEKFLQSQGITETTQEGRFAALSRLGIDTSEKLTEAGVKEERERRALVNTVKFRADIVKKQREIQEQARPGYLQGRRRSIEDELPEFVEQRKILQQRATNQQQRLQTESLRTESARLRVGAGLMGMGLDSSTFVTEEGEATGFFGMSAAIGTAMFERMLPGQQLPGSGAVPWRDILGSLRTIADNTATQKRKPEAVPTVEK